MSSTDELLRELEEDDTSTSDPMESPTTEESRIDGLTRRAGRAFSPRAFLTALIVVVAGFVLGSFVPLPLGPIGSYIGIFVATFGFGLASRKSRYTESGLAGGLVTGVSAFFEYIVFTIAGIGVPVILLSTIIGLVAALAGHYFGRDLRDGITRDIQ